MKVSNTYDLRSIPELKRMEKETPIIEIEGITRNFVPVFKDVDYSPEYHPLCLPRLILPPIAYQN